MPFKGLVQDLRDGLGSFSRRHVGSFDLRPLPPPVPDCLRRSRSLGVVYGAQQSGWAAMPPELLREVVRRLEQGQSSWPSRRSLVACASVCRHWRSTTLDLLHLNQSGFLTFPFSLKQPGPWDRTVMQCFIKRERSTSTFRLYLGLTPTLSENGKFLLSARRFRRATRTEYIISLNADDTSQASTSYVGKLRSNFLGTKFTIYDSDASYGGVTVLPSSSSSRLGGGGGGRRIGSKRVSPRVPSAGSYNVGNIQYELNVLGTRGPRRMQCTLDAMTRVAEGSGEGVGECLDRSGSLPSSKETEASLAVSGKPGDAAVAAAIILKNKAPRWHEQLQCWCLNFRGRVTVASVKNFQLVNALDPPITLERSDPNYPNEYDQVLLQFGKIGKDTFTMDYRHPLSAFQAFAISLTSFDTKLACE